MLVLVVAAVLGCAAPVVEVPAASNASVAADLDAARRAEADLDYATARALIAAVLQSDQATSAQLLQAHELAGQIERTAGNDGLAREHFLVVLRANPTWALPADVPPKVAMFFELVRQDVVAEQPVVVVAPPEPAAVAAPPIAGIVVTSVAGAAVVAGVVVGALGEGQFAQSSASWDARSAGRTMALAGWSTTTVGVVLGAVGAALLVSAASAP
jgi:hypothetical protein